MSLISSAPRLPFFPLSITMLLAASPQDSSRCLAHNTSKCAYDMEFTCQPLFFEIPE